MSVVLWYRVVADTLGVTTPRAVEKRIEPESFKVKKNGDRFNPGKWRWYEPGLHVPELSLRNRTELHVPGSKALLAHPRWEVLSNPAVGGQGDDLLGRLQPDVQTWLYESDAMGVGKRVRRVMTSEAAAIFENSPGLDAVAALSVLVLEASEAGRPDDANALATRLWRVILLASIERPIAAIVVPLFKALAKTIFPRASSSRFEFSLHHARFDFLCSVLALAAHKEDEALNWSESREPRTRLASARIALDGGQNGAYRHAFVPPQVCIPDAATRVAEHLKSYRREHYGYMSSIGQILQGTLRLCPPNDERVITRTGAPLFYRIFYTLWPIEQQKGYPARVVDPSSLG